MAQFNTDVDSGIIGISQFICSFFPGMSQATLSSRAFAVPVHIEGLAPSEIGTEYTFDLCRVLLFRVQLLVNALPADCHDYQQTLSRPVAVKQLPGPSLPTTDGTV